MSTKTRKLGVLQLNTAFSRPPGDVSNPATWGDVPVVVRVVEEATSELVVGGGWGKQLVDAFARAGQKLIEEENCVAFVTSCGFLATMHPLLAQRLPYMGTSSLIQVAWLQNQVHPGPDSAQSVGVVTFKRSALTEKHLTSVGAHADTPITGLPETTDPAQGIFKAVLECRIPYDYEGMEAEVVSAALELVKANSKVKAIVLECTNMPPFTHAVEKATGLRVWDVVTLGKWLYHGATPRDFRPWEQKDIVH
ncbi:hypothetical protein Q5752_004213 [Cryptotrichosporon argae]